MRKQGIGVRAEERLNTILCNYGRSVTRCAYSNSYDLVVDGYRTEVKCASFQRDGEYALTWNFNIHRHGKLSEQTDLYILRLEDVPYTKAAIHMLLKAPIGKSTIGVSMRALLNQDWAAAVADFYALARGEYGRKEVAA